MVEVMMIRPEKEIGMGCCGGVCGDEDALVNMDKEFEHHEPQRQQMGELYKKSEDSYGKQVEIIYLDPRNLLAISAYFFNQLKSHHITLKEAFTHFFLHMKYGAVFVNGKRALDDDEYDKLIRQSLVLKEV